jgi:FkbM family methyltransferase
MVIAVLRAAFRLWPFMHGRGWILRVAKLLLGHRTIRFDIGGGTFIEGTLDDWMILWTFMCQHERDEGFQHSLALLPRGGVAFDVGAHIGIWSLLAARRAQASRIHAFEPVPRQYERLRAHAALNHVTSIVINNCAVGAENGSTSFFAVYEGNTGASSLARRHDDDVEIHTDVITLDTYVEKNGIERVDVMKIDVEGAEILVLRGARQLLSSEQAPVIFFEADDRLAASFQSSMQAVRQLLVECGYDIYRWHRSRYVPVEAGEEHEHEDLFALKPRHVAT